MSTAEILTNNPPDDTDPLRERLEESHGALTARQAELLAASARVPAEVKDEDTAGRVADFIKQLMACTKALEGARVAEKEPFLASGRAVDGFFKKLTDPLAATKKEIEARLTAFQRKKADEGRKRREEAERAARAEAERDRKAAEEAAAKAQDDSTLDTAINAEEDARRLAEAAQEAERAAEAKAADLSRSRGDHGAVASLRTEWVGELVDREELDLHALRQHIPTDALEKAIRSFVKAGGRQLRGAKIYEKHSTVVR